MWVVYLIILGLVFSVLVNSKGEDEGLWFVFVLWIIFGVTCSFLEDPEWEEKATPYEITLLRTVDGKNSGCWSKYYNTMEAISKRKFIPSQDKPPFHDVYLIVEIDDTKKCKFKTVTFDKVLQSTEYGSLRGLQNIPEKETEIVVDTPDEDAIITAVEEEEVTENTDNVLPPEMYDKIVDAVKSCNRAKVDVLDITKDKEYLTYKDYEEVMGIITKCKSLQLQVELNK